MVLADIQEVRKKPSVWEPPRGWSPDLLTDPYLAKLGRFKAPVPVGLLLPPSRERGLEGRGRVNQ